MVDEVNEISFDEFAEIFRAKTVNGEAINREDIVRAWNNWQRQDCFLCHSPDVKFRALFEPSPEKIMEYGAPDKMNRLFMYSLCDVCFDHRDIEQISEVILKCAVEAPVH